MDKLGKMLSGRHGLRILSEGSVVNKERAIRTYPAETELAESFEIVTDLGINRVRISVSWGSFAADSISSLSLINSTESALFEAYAKDLNTKGARVDFKINEYPTDPENIVVQGDKISAFELQLSSPIIDLSDSNEDELIEVAFEWSSPVWGMMLSIFPTEELDPESDELGLGLPEGAKTKVEVNRYERNRKYRNLCLTIHGSICKVCDFDFGNSFGALGKGFIHVHHLVPVSKMTEDYKFDPVNDLIPVCPNCHAMIHRENPPIPIEKLKSIMLECKNEHA